MPSVVLVDAMTGVVEGLRWILATAPDIQVVGEATTVAEAQRIDAQVVVSGLRLADGVAADLVRRPVIVHTWLPADERSASDTSGVVELVEHGALRSRLAAAIRRAAA